MTIKGNNTGATANELDLTTSQVLTMLGLSSAITGSGTANNVTMFTGPHAVGDAPGFAYNTDGETPTYYITGADFSTTNTISSVAGFSSSGGSIFIGGLSSLIGGILTNLSGTGNRLVTAAATGLLGNSTTIDGSYSFAALAGTGTRLVTSTSAGGIGNATTIAGDYTFSGNVAVSTLLTGGSVQIGVDGPVSAAGRIRISSFDGLEIRGYGGTHYDLQILNAAGTLLISNNGTSRLDISVPLTLTEYLEFSANGTSGQYRIFRNASNGLKIRGGTGATNDFAVSTADDTKTLIANPTGTANLTLGTSTGTVLISGNAQFAGSIELTTAASGGAGKIWKSSGSGLVMEGVTASTYDFSILNPAAQYLLRNPTGTQNIEFVNNVWTLGTLTAGGGTAAATLVVNGASANNRTLSFQTGGSARWAWVVDNTAESGANAGSKIFLRAFTDAGATIDSPIDIIRASGGLMTLARPVAMTSGVALSGNGNFTLDDNSSTALVVKEGSNNYLKVSTVNASENIAFGNATTNPTFSFLGSGGVAFNGGISSVASLASGWYEEGTFTATLTGVSGSVTGTAYWTRTGKMVTLLLPGLAGTSNATTCTITGMSSGIFPARKISRECTIADNGALFSGVGYGFEIGTSGTITLYLATSAGGFTNSGTKGLAATVSASVGSAYLSIAYTIQ
jgi:hypothetical protein